MELGCPFAIPVPEVPGEYSFKELLGGYHAQVMEMVEAGVAAEQPDWYMVHIAYDMATKCVNRGRPDEALKWLGLEITGREKGTGLEHRMTLDRIVEVTAL